MRHALRGTKTLFSAADCARVFGKLVVRPGRQHRTGCWGYIVDGELKDDVAHTVVWWDGKYRAIRTVFRVYFGAMGPPKPCRWRGCVRPDHVPTNTVCVHAQPLPRQRFVAATSR